MSLINMVNINAYTKFYQFIPKILKRNKILILIQGQNSVEK